MIASELPLSRTMKVGGIRVHLLEAGLQWLDGGAMFGVVPRPLWEKKIPPDERHRIPLALRCLLIEAPNALVLVDTGVGDKESEKFRKIYGVDNEGSPTRLQDAMASLDIRPGDVEMVISTHLHFDHAGGNTLRTEDGSFSPAFPNARHIMHAGELNFGVSPNERIRASYMEKNFIPLTEAGLVDTVDGESLLVDGVRVLTTPGHTPYHQSVVVESQGETAIFLADLCPTSAHLPLPWIMGYDVEPLVTLQTKKTLWERIRKEGWTMIFQHDAEVAWGVLDPDEEEPILNEVK